MRIEHASRGNKIAMKPPMAKRKATKINSNVKFSQLLLVYVFNLFFRSKPQHKDGTLVIRIRLMIYLVIVWLKISTPAAT